MEMYLLMIEVSPVFAVIEVEVLILKLSGSGGFLSMGTKQEFVLC